MQRIHFSRVRFAGAALFFGTLFLFFLSAFLNPEEYENVRRARWMATELGHTLILPVLMILCAAMALRALSIAVGDTVAVELTATQLRLNPVWTSTKQLPWDCVHRATAQWYMGHAQLSVETRKGTKIKVPLGGTNFDNGRVAGLLDAINERSGSGVGADTWLGFNPDLAIERYLSRRAAEAVEATDVPNTAAAPAPSPFIEPQRPTFGRKRV